MTEAEPRLCIALPTRDREELAVGALESVVGQLRPDDELMVVDNGPAPSRRLREWLRERRPDGLLVHEPRGGLSIARNTALRAANASVVCFIDDDVRADPGWLEALRRAWAEAEPRVAAIGGPMLAAWQAPRPPWLADHLLHVVSVLEIGEERRRLDQRPGTGYLWGGNISVRADAVREVGGFDPELGTRPGARFDRGEEEDLQRRLASREWEVWYEPAAAVDHLIFAERLTQAYFRGFFRHRGLRDAARGRSRRRAVRVLVRSGVRYTLLRLLRRPGARRASFAWIYGWTLLTASRKGSKQPF